MKENSLCFPWGFFIIYSEDHGNTLSVVRGTSYCIFIVLTHQAFLSCLCSLICHAPQQGNSRWSKTMNSHLSYIFVWTAQLCMIYEQNKKKKSVLLCMNTS